MALVTVELLVSFLGETNLEAVSKGDVIAVQPSGHEWGVGDLTGRSIFCVELDIPCGDDWKKTVRCSQCEYAGIVWPDGTEVELIAVPDVSCPVRKYSSADVEFELVLTDKKVETLKTNLINKFSHKIDYLSFMSPDTVLSIEKEVPKVEGGSNISKETQVLRLNNARKNPINSGLVVKV